MSSSTANDRLTTELSLLEAMYPDQITFTPHRRELKYLSDVQNNKATLVLRLADTYPEQAAGVAGVEVISAKDERGGDVRERMKGVVDEVEREQGGGEVIDAVIAGFDGVVRDRESLDRNGKDEGGHDENAVSPRKTKTVIIWLHHLLNTNKRKLALNSTGTGEVRGITKPGYPGILVYSGVGPAVDAHVAELRAQRWQAFQVRLEVEVEGEGWEFEHGKGVVEVESMADVVQGIRGEEHRQEFLRAVGIK